MHSEKFDNTVIFSQDEEVCNFIPTWVSLAIQHGDYANVISTRRSSIMCHDDCGVLFLPDVIYNPGRVRSIFPRVGHRSCGGRDMLFLRGWSWCSDTINTSLFGNPTDTSQPWSEYLQWSREACCEVRQGW